MTYIFDLIVIGGGHAGVEAALVGKRFDLNVALITLDKNKSGRMSCNPAVGGIGKTHLAKEIDALGGYMAIFPSSNFNCILHHSSHSTN